MMRYRLLAWLLLLLSSPAWADCPRIVSQSPYITHTLEWLGLESCIVGVSRYDTLDRPRTGGVMDPDPAAIAALKPELLLTSDWTAAEVWRLATPPGAKALRLHGFQSMAQVEENLLRIGEAAGLPDAKQRAAAFARAWREGAAAAEGHGTRALLLSACNGSPYSFGRGSWLGDLFSAAGFQVVGGEKEIIHFSGDGELRELRAAVGKYRPAVIFVFERRETPSCNVALSQMGVRLVLLDGAQFLHPAPVLLQGLEQLAAKRRQWEVKR